MGDVVFRGRVVGRVDADGVFWRVVRQNQVLRSPPAVSLHRDVLDQLVALGCRSVAFTMPDGALLTAPLSIYTGRGIVVDRGYGEQVAVLLTDFARLSAPVTRQVEVVE